LTDLVIIAVENRLHDTFWQK